MVDLLQLHTKHQRKCRLATKIPLTFREPTGLAGHDDTRISHSLCPQGPPSRRPKPV